MDVSRSPEIPHNKGYEARNENKIDMENIPYLPKASIKDAESIGSCAPLTNSVIANKNNSYTLAQQSTFNRQIARKSSYSKKLNQLLVHAHESIALSSISSIAEAHFADEVHEELQSRGFEVPFRIQSYGWPHLMRGNSLVLVNDVKTAKTWTYLPVICTLISEQISDNRIVEGDGPVVIVLCPYSTEVINVVKCCRKLLEGSLKMTTCIGAYGQLDNTRIVDELLNGVHLLVATIPCLVRLMTNELNLFNKKRIKTIVFDEVDVMIEQFGKERFNEIYKTFCAHPNNEIQSVVISKTWHKVLNKFCQRRDTLLCIGDFIEAAIYAKSEMTVRSVINENNRKEEFLSYIKRIEYSYEQLVVICNQKSEVEELVNILRSETISTNYHHELSEIDKTKNLVKNSQIGELSVLVVTDDVLHDLEVRHAQHIIHYSFPPSWKVFSQRFLVSFDYYENLLQENKTAKGRPSSLIFIDEETSDSLPLIVDFMRTRCSASVPKHVLELTEKKRIEREENHLTKYKPFCNQLLGSGICRADASSNCTTRHVLTKYDGPRKNIPRNGTVKFQIISTKSPVHFTVRLLEHRPLYHRKWQKIPYANKYISFQLEFRNYFNDRANHKVHHPPELGNLCAIDTDTNGYQRCKIIGIKETNSVTTLRLLLIDTNVSTSCKITDILELPQRFKHFPHQAVDMRISGVVPHDSDIKWDSKTTNIVECWIRDDKNSHYEAVIELSLMNCIWVKSIEIIQRLSAINQEIRSSSIKDSLIKKNLGLPDKKGLHLLQEMAEKAGLLDTRPHTLQPIVTKNSLDVQRRRRRGEIFTERPIHTSSDESDEDSLASNKNKSCFMHSNSKSENGCSSTDESIGNIDDHIYNTSISSSGQNSFDSGKEQWVELTLGMLYKVRIGTFFTPERFYVQKCNESLSMLNRKIDEYTDNADNLKSLVQMNIDKICLAKIDGYYSRAKILNVKRNGDEIIVNVFFVDIGDTLTMPQSDIIDIPQRFIEQLPFQAILCKIIGINPLKNTGYWTTSTVDSIYYRILTKCSDIFIRPIERVRAGDVNNNELTYASYNSIFLDAIFGNINNLIVTNAYAEFDPTTKHFLDILIDRKLLRPHDFDEDDWDDDEYNATFEAGSYLPSTPHKSVLEEMSGTIDGLDLDIYFSENDICKWLEFPEGTRILQENGESIFRSKPAVTVTPAVLGNEKTNKKNKLPTKPLPTASAQKVTIVRSTNLQLFQPHQTPHIIWDQSKEVIILTISAPDISDYYLKVGQRLVHFCYARDDTHFAVMLNLFGCVDVNYTSHEIRGLNVVVRLLKLLPGLPWSRLVQSPDKNQFIKRKFNGMNENDKAHVNGFLCNTISNIPSSDTDDDDNVNLSNDEDDIEV